MTIAKLRTTAGPKSSIAKLVTSGGDPAEQAVFRLTDRGNKSRHPASRSASVSAFIRISDPEIKSRIEELKIELSKDPAAARRFLEEIGYLTPKGNITARYA